VSESSGRGGLWVAVAIVAGLLGLAAWFTMGGATTGHETPAGGQAITRPATGKAPEDPIFHPSEPPPTTPLTTPPVAAGTRPPLVTDTVASTPLASAAHVVARGHVRWAGGQVPYESDVKLYDVDGSDLDVAYTDAEGAFELTSEDPLAEGWSFGTDAIAIKGKGAAASLAPALVSNLPAHAVGDPPVERDLIIGFAPVLTGRVVDKATQQPIAGAEIYVASTLAAYAYDGLDATTGPDGRYVLPITDLPLTGMLVWCRADDYQASLAGPLDMQPVAAPTDVTTQDFALAAAIVVKGRVTDSRTGEPIDGAIITVGSRFTSFVDLNDFEVTDDEGHFELETSEIPFEGGWLVFNATDCAAAVVPLERGVSFLEVALGEPFVVAGIVRDSTGRGVAHARLEIAFDGDTPEIDQDMFDQADCDMDGRFETTLEVVPDQNAIVHVDQLGKQPFRGRLTEIGRLIGGNRWELDIRLADE